MYEWHAGAATRGQTRRSARQPYPDRGYGDGQEGDEGPYEWNVHHNTRPVTAHEAAELYQKSMDWKKKNAARSAALTGSHWHGCLLGANIYISSPGFYFL